VRSHYRSREFAVAAFSLDAGVPASQAACVDALFLHCRRSRFRETVDALLLSIQFAVVCSISISRNCSLSVRLRRHIFVGPFVRITTTFCTVLEFAVHLFIALATSRAELSPPILQLELHREPL
jgi:hypothetical protein